MTYRDESDALRAKVARLETDLAQAEEKIAALSGVKAPESNDAQVQISPITGGPRGVSLSRTFPYELDTEGYEAIAALARERLKVEVSQVGRSLTTKGDVLSLRVEGGKTTVRVKRELAGDGAVIGFGLMASSFGGLWTYGILHDIALHHAGVSLLHVAWIAPALGAAAVAIARRAVKRTTTRELAEHQAAFEAIVALAEKHPLNDAPKTRVAVESEPAAESEAEAEADASRERSSSA